MRLPWAVDRRPCSLPRRVSQSGVAPISRRAALGPGLLGQVADTLFDRVDPILGGICGVPIRPMLPVFCILWQDSFRTGDLPGRGAVHFLLRQVGQGGIYDHLGGGFARYATDQEWLVLHFEKML